MRWLLRFAGATLGSGAALCGCGFFDTSRDCGPHGFEAGERFRVTVLGVKSSGLDTTDPKNANAGAVEDAGTLECAPLHIGDSFVMEAGPWLDGLYQCDSSRMINKSAPFGADQVSYCDSDGEGQLELRCREDIDPNTCTRSMSFTTYPIIKPTDQVIEDGRLQVTWSTCESGCSTTFSVRIERLPPAVPDAG